MTLDDRISALVLQASRRLSDACDSGEVPGAALAVAAGGTTVLEAAFGLASVEDGVAATVDTPFSLASVTKPMVGTALAVLAERGALDLDAQVSRYRPLPGHGTAPTLRQVANHTGGFPTFLRFFYGDEIDRAPSKNDLLRAYARVVFPPGVRQTYSNVGYELLGAIIEEVTGSPLADALSELVFEPLEMRSARFGEPDGGPGAARRHTSSGSAYPPYVTGHGAAAEAWCSVRDLLRFGLAHAGGMSALPAEALAASHRPTAPWPGADGYGIGWGVRRHGDLSIAFHGGSMGGVAAYLVAVPTAGIVIAALANVQSGRELLISVTNDILAALLPGFTPLTRADGSPDGELLSAPAAEVGGEWSGSLDLPSGAVPLFLSIAPDGSGTARWDSTDHAITKLRVTDSSVTVELDGLADAPDLAARPHAPALWLHRTAATELAGGLAAIGVQNADHPLQPDIVVWPASLRLA
ncbi:serine hydrolase domain-containing protein [Streptosporangium sp. NPDC005286]|uniref:serine hydrolase domain-containing protein n=1 Tax=Streptosporangium sp. NPDC005286 TaxID=3154463 RepID=UPI0033AF0F17